MTCISPMVYRASQTKHRTENDVGFRVSRFLDDSARFTDFMKGEIVASCNVNEDSPSTLDCGFFEKRTKDRSLGGAYSPIVAIGNSSAYPCRGNRG